MITKPVENFNPKWINNENNRLVTRRLSFSDPVYGPPERSKEVIKYPFMDSTILYSMESFNTFKRL